METFFHVLKSPFVALLNLSKIAFESSVENLFNPKRFCFLEGDALFINLFNSYFHLLCYSRMKGKNFSFLPLVKYNVGNVPWVFVPLLRIRVLCHRNFFCG